MNALAPVGGMGNTASMIKLFQSLAFVFALIALPGSGAAKDLTVFAAASLKGALDEAAERWDAPVVMSYGGSGQIARQVAQGAPADLVILANSAWMEWLLSQGGVEGTPVSLTSNSLVVVAPEGAAMLEASDLPERLDNGRLAMGNTLGVPAGIYGRQWLEHAGLWEAVRTRLAETENVRAALALVARKEALLGVVYASDAQAEPRVQVVLHVPSDAHDPILYPMLVLEGENTQQAAEFASFLISGAGRDVFLKHGFSAYEAPQ